MLTQLPRFNRDIPSVFKFQILKVLAYRLRKFHGLVLFGQQNRDHSHGLRVQRVLSLKFQ